MALHFLFLLALLPGCLLGAPSDKERPPKTIPPHYFLRVANVLPFGSPPAHISSAGTAVIEELYSGTVSNYIPLPLAFDHWTVQIAENTFSLTIPQCAQKKFFTIFLLPRGGGTTCEVVADDPPSTPPPEPGTAPEHRLRLVGFGAIPGLHLAIGSVKSLNLDRDAILETLALDVPKSLPVTLSYRNRRGELVVMRRALEFRQARSQTLIVGQDGPTRPFLRVLADAVYPGDTDEADLVEAIESFSTP